MPFGWDDAITLGLGILGSEGTSDANDANQALFYQNQAWQEHMRSTAHQTEVADLKQAGLNPMLSFMSKGAAMGSVSQPKMENEASAGIAGAAQAASVQNMKAQNDLIKEQTAKTRVESANVEADTLKKLIGEIPELTQRATTGEYSAANLNAQTGVLGYQWQKVKEEIENLKAERDRIKSDTAQKQFELKYILPLEEQLHEMEVVRRHLGNKVLWPEAKFSERMGEFRPAGKDLAPLLNSAGSLLRRRR